MQRETTEGELSVFKAEVERAKAESSQNLPSWARSMQDEEYSEYFSALAGNTNSKRVNSESANLDRYRGSFAAENTGSSSQTISSRLQSNTQKSALSFSPDIIMSRQYSNDTSLYAVLIKRGEGERLVKLLIRKCALHSSQNQIKLSQDCGISTIFISSKDSNYIYIESYSKRHVISIISGCADIYATQITCIPLSDRKKIMASCFSAVSASAGDFARLKNLKFYHNDVCQIMQIRGSNATVRVVPRLDFTERMDTPRQRYVEKDKVTLKISQSKPNLGPESQDVSLTVGQHLKDTQPCPSKKLFNPACVEGAEKRGNHWHWQSHLFTEDGFLLKIVPVSQLVLHDKMTPLSSDEKNLFTKVADQSSQNDMRSSFPFNGSHSYSSGETVRVVSMTYNGSVGTVLQSDKNKITVRMEGSKAVVHLDTTDVRPHFALDSAVVILAGPYQGRRGSVVAHLPHLESIIVHLQDEGKEIQVLSTEIDSCDRFVACHTPNKGKRVGPNNNFREGDLVDFVESKDFSLAGAQHTLADGVAYVIKVTASYLLCLLANNTLVQVDPNNAQRKNTAFMKSFRDRNDSVVHVGECVRISSLSMSSFGRERKVAGLQSKRVATVKIIWDDIVFLQEAENLHNNVTSIFAENRRNLISVNKRSRNHPSDADANLKSQARSSTMVHPSILYNE